MVDVTKPIYGDVWANTGEKLAPDSAKIATGWIQEMMPYQYENFLQNRADTAITYLLQKGVAEWSSEQEYIANKSVVTYGGQLYMATATTTNVLPTVTASWKKLSVSYGANGAIPVSFGGTGATTAVDARTNLGIGSAATANLPAGNGMLVKLTDNTLVARSVAGTAGYITVANGNGVDGNPIISVGANVAKTDADAAWTTTSSIRLPAGSTAQRGTGAPGRIRFNLETGVYEGYDNTGWNPIGSVGVLDVQNFQGDGVRTAFTLSSTPRAENNTQVYFNGVYQQKNTYNLVGNDLVFDEAPTSDISIEVVNVSSVPIGTTTAAQTSIVDSGNYYNSSNVEGALQYVGETLSNAVLTFPDYTAASAAAATLPDGQEIEAPNAEGRISRFNVQSGALVFKDYAPDSIRIQSYTALRAYTGKAQAVDITTQGLAGTFNFDDADTTTPDNGGTVIVGADGRRWKRAFSGPVFVTWFGARSDIDSTEAIRAAHAYANAQKLEVNYEGLESIKIQAGAQIDLQTSTNFTGAAFDPIGGVQDPLTFAGGFFEAYIVTDPACPLETVAGTFDAANLYAGSLYPTKGVFDGQGYAYLRNTTFRVPNRDGTGDVAYTQAFDVVRGGKAVEPLSVTLDAATTTLQVRRYSQNRLRLDGIVIKEGTWNKQRFFVIRRCNVDIGKIVHRYQTDAGVPNICDLIYAEHVADFNMEGIDGSGMQYSGISGTYLFNGLGVASARFKDIRGCTGWGWIGTNHVNGMYFNNCDVNRIDGHAGCHNIYVDGGTLGANGVFYGWGGGVIRVSETSCFGVAVVMTRNDYGGTFFGDIEIDAVSLTPNESYAGIVDLGFNPIGASIWCYCPKTVRVTGVTVRSGKSTTTRVDVFRVAKKAGSSQVVAPESVLIDGVLVGGNSLTPYVTIPYADLQRAGVAANSLKLNNIKTDIALVLIVAAQTSAPPATPTFDIDVDGVTRIKATIAHSGRYISHTNGLIESFGTAGGLVTFNGSKFIQFGASTKIGSPYVNGTNYTSVIGCNVSGNFDFSDVAAIIGMVIGGSSVPTLPAGVTRATAFTGYRSASLG